MGFSAADIARIGTDCPIRALATDIRISNWGIIISSTCIWIKDSVVVRRHF